MKQFKLQVNPCVVCCDVIIKALTTLLGRVSPSVGRENGPERGLKTVSYNHCLPVIESNSADPDQTPQNAASDQGLHCLPMSQSRFHR